MGNCNKNVSYKDYDFNVEYNYAPDESFSSGACEEVTIESILLDTTEVLPLISPDIIEELETLIIDTFHN